MLSKVCVCACVCVTSDGGVDPGAAGAGERRLGGLGAAQTHLGAAGGGPGRGAAPPGHR